MFKSNNIYLPGQRQYLTGSQVIKAQFFTVFAIKSFFKVSKS